mgnify:CR=1 FL=1
MNNTNNVDVEYFRIVNEILSNGRIKKNRTGIDTIGIFGAQAKYDVNLNAFPVLTTKKVHFPAIVHELLWFINGDTNIKYLVDNNVKIWNECAYAKYKKFMETGGGSISIYGVREAGCRSTSPFSQEQFINLIKTDPIFAENFGDLGEGTYGGMWRDFPFFTIVDKNNPSTMPKFTSIGTKGMYTGDEPAIFLGRVDQLTKVIEKLKNNPDDRRIIVSAWHPHWIDHCALPPCHCLFQFHTEELTWKERLEIAHYKDYKNENMYYKYSDEDFDKISIPRRRLNCLLYQRSQDSALGCPFNVTSYSLLTAMIAHVLNMIPGTFTHSTGDTHIYVNHIDGLKLQLTREPKNLPKLWLNPEIKSLFDFKYEDIKLLDYDPHPAIKMSVAV